MRLCQGTPTSFCPGAFGRHSHLSKVTEGQTTAKGYSTTGEHLEGSYALIGIVKGLVILLHCVMLELIVAQLLAICFDGKYHRLYRYLKSFHHCQRNCFCGTFVCRVSDFITESYRFIDKY